ncbi:MAG: FAD-dependent oxidoreductase [Terrimicrobiaceae bacterium]
MNIHIPAQEIPVLAEADVVVCGGGSAGVSTAVSAARTGARVILLERWSSVGGMTTNGLVNGWHRSDKEKLVIHGLVEESCSRAEKHGWIWRDRRYPHAHETHWFEPEGMRIVWHRMLEEAKVRVFCHLPCGEPVVEGGRIRAVLVDTKQGRRAVTGRIFIDATGDGDIAAKAGVPFDRGREEDGLGQSCTLIFALWGIDSEGRAKGGGDAAVEKVIARMTELRNRGEFPPFAEALSGHFLRNARDGDMWNMLPVVGDILDEEKLTRMCVRAREQLVSYLELWRREMPGFAEARIARTGSSLGLRESRRIRGRMRLEADMVLEARKQPDALGHGVWMIDIHDPKGSGDTTHGEKTKDGWQSGDRAHTAKPAKRWLKPGTSYHIPYAMCLTNEISNLGVVGRCTSATHEALGSVRVQTHCQVMGQGVGTAAAIAVDRGLDLADVPIRELQHRLKADGVYLEDIPLDAPPNANRRQSRLPERQVPCL